MIFGPHLVQYLFLVFLHGVYVTSVCSGCRAALNQLFRQQFVHHLGVGLALGQLHNLAHEEAPEKVATHILGWLAAQKKPGTKPG